MEYIKSYVLSIAGVMIASAVIEAIVPEKSFKKYIKTVLGLVILTTLAKPVLNFSDFDSILQKYSLYADYDLSVPETAFSEENTDTLIKSEFEKNLCKTIENDIKKDLGKDCVINAQYSDGNIKNVTAVCSDTDFDEISEYILKKYDLNCTKK